MNCLRLTILSFTVLLSLSFTQAQTPEWLLRMETPRELENTRSSFSAETASNMELLAVWGLGEVIDAVWLDEEHMVLATMGGIWLYDLETETASEVVLSFNPSDPHTIEILLSPDGQWLTLTVRPRISLHDGWSYFLWHLPTGQRFNLNELGGNWTYTNPPYREDMYESVRTFTQWLPDNRLLIASNDNLVVWNLDSGVPQVDEIYVHPANERTGYHIERTVVSNDMRWIATVTHADISEQLIVQVWNTSTGERRVFYEDEFLANQEQYPFSLQFNQDETELALSISYRVQPPEGYSYYQSALWRWSVEDGELLAQTDLDCSTRSINFAKDYMLCSSQDGQSFAVRRLSSGEILSDGNPLSIDMWEDSEYFAILAYRSSTEPQRHFFLWDEMAAQVAIFELEEAPTSFAMSPNKAEIAIIYPNKVEIWDIANQSLEKTIEEGGILHFTSLALSPDSQTFLSVGSDNPYFNYYAPDHQSRILVWDMQTGIPTQLPNEDDAYTVRFTIDGSQFVIGRNDGTLAFYDTQTLRVQNTYVNGGAIRAIAFSHDGRLMAVANQDYIRFWDLRTMTVINRVEGSSRNLLEFTPDGNWLVASDSLYKVENRAQLVARWQWTDTDEAFQEQWNLSITSGAGIAILGHNYETEQVLLAGDSLYINLIDPIAQQQIWSQYFQPYTSNYELGALGNNLIVLATDDGVLHLYGIQDLEDSVEGE
jgi:WD40 repeat protein